MMELNSRMACQSTLLTSIDGKLVDEVGEVKPPSAKPRLTDPERP